MQGKIIKGIAGFYYVYAGGTVYECKAKGVFRNRRIKPLVGDNVEITVIDREKAAGHIEEILPRRCALVRPAVANVDQAVIVFAAASPEPNLNLLDRFLVMMERQEVPVVICLNKTDLVHPDRLGRLAEIYSLSGCPMIVTSTCTEHGLDRLREQLRGKTTALAGPSGVGKSSIMNCLNPEANMEVGDISRKIERGKHTTRHSEMFPIGGDGFVLDTPGFGSIELYDMEAEELKRYYREFERYEPQCRFQGCNHVGETECGVREAVREGWIPSERYENYRLFFQELKERKRY